MSNSSTSFSALQFILHDASCVSNEFVDNVAVGGSLSNYKSYGQQRSPLKSSNIVNGSNDTFFNEKYSGGFNALLDPYQSSFTTILSAWNQWISSENVYQLDASKMMNDNSNEFVCIASNTPPQVDVSFTGDTIVTKEDNDYSLQSKLFKGSAFNFYKQDSFDANWILKKDFIDANSMIQQQSHHTSSSCNDKWGSYQTFLNQQQNQSEEKAEVIDGIIIQPSSSQNSFSNEEDDGYPERSYPMGTLITLRTLELLSGREMAELLKIE